MNDDELIQTMTGRIVSSFSPERVILFGSRARGTANPNSDVDLLIVMKKVRDKRSTSIQIRQVLADLPIAKDVFVTTPEEIRDRGDLVGTVLRPALREGIVLYERV